MECELIIYIRQRWTDFRLSWNKTYYPAATPLKRLKVREHLLDKIWLPDIRITNLKEMNQFEKFGGINMNIHPSGTVYYSQLALIRIHCPMDLRNFPMDQQTCCLNFSSYAYAKSLLTFVLQKKEILPVHLPQFEFVEAKECVVENQEKLKVKRISVALIFKRRSGYYILQIYIPSMSLVFLSWLVFLMDPADIANRLVLVTTMLVSMVFLHTQMNTSLPPVSYAKAADWFVLVSFGFILVALLETSWVYRTSTRTSKKSKPMKNYRTSFQLCMRQNEDEISAPHNQDKKSSSFERNTSRKEYNSLSKVIDKLSLVLFPLMYGGFNIFYWFYFMK
ncbi:gamma-aminobutyric acid receptor subunit rho-3-like isoform X1 [Paramuricea clavata]|uniref:Gamma-aminobutyric acid receptor subunit rho-3-like isoform X1 n=2 Tax=Paramuricea clavata TaxID=317549 RepID=A0A6S7JWR1_PARCT|nr:gamma-aminobutyric acid receptor subunit rho-3-like isoform X1 [Paramuricea clavata]